MRQEIVIAVVLTVAAMVFSAVTYSMAQQIVVIHPMYVDYQVGQLGQLGANDSVGGHRTHSTVPSFPAVVPQGNKPVNPNNIPRHTKYRYQYNNKVKYPSGGSYSSGTKVVIVRNFRQIKATSYGYAYHQPVVHYTVYHVPQL